IHLPVRHWHVGDISTPNLIRARNNQITEQIGVFFMFFIWDRSAWFTIDRFHSNLSSQSLYSLAIDYYWFFSFFEHSYYFSASNTWVFKKCFFHKLDMFNIFLTSFNGFII